MSSGGAAVASAERASGVKTWAPLVVSALLFLTMLVMFAVSGSLLGPMDGDIPYPATAHEEATYYLGRNLAWAAVVAGAIAALLVALVARMHQVRAAVGWGVVVLILVASLGVATFFFAFGAAN